jgi:hypothetical protein
MPIFAKPTVPIYGYVGFVSLTVRTGNDNYDGDLLGYARERHRELEADIYRQVQETLGADFEVLNVEFRKGSFVLLIALGAVGTFYMGFSRYESFIKSVNLLVSQLRGLLQRFFGEAPLAPRHKLLSVLLARGNPLPSLSPPTKVCVFQPELTHLILFSDIFCLAMLRCSLC